MFLKNITNSAWKTVAWILKWFHFFRDETACCPSPKELSESEVVVVSSFSTKVTWHREEMLWEMCSHHILQKKKLVGPSIACFPWLKQYHLYIIEGSKPWWFELFYATCWSNLVIETSMLMTKNPVQEGVSVRKAVKAVNPPRPFTPKKWRDCFLQPENRDGNVGFPDSREFFLVGTVSSLTMPNFSYLRDVNSISRYKFSIDAWFRCFSSKSTTKSIYYNTKLDLIQWQDLTALRSVTTHYDQVLICHPTFT